MLPVICIIADAQICKIPPLMSEERKKEGIKLKRKFKLFSNSCPPVDSIWKQAFVLTKRLPVRSMETAFDHRYVLAFCFFSP